MTISELEGLSVEDFTNLVAEKLTGNSENVESGINWLWETVKRAEAVGHFALAMRLKDLGAQRLTRAA